MSSSALGNISIQAVIDPAVNYAMQQHNIPIVKTLTLTNAGEHPLTEICLCIQAEPEFCPRCTINIDSIAPNSSYHVNNAHLALSPTYLRDIPEKLNGQLHFTAKCAEGMEAHLVSQIEILSHDQWPGSRCSPELLASFILPNHPATEQLAAAAGNILLRHTGDGSLSGYQSRDRKRVQATAGAVFTAIQEAGIGYCNPPANFENQGQKIRLPHRIMEHRLATCLDLACFCAAALEQCGLHPIILLTGGHAFAGVWLVQDAFPEAVGDDARRVSKRVELGEIYVFDPTVATNSAATFVDATATARAHLGKPEEILFVVDVKTCRNNNVHPLPIGTPTTAPDNSERPSTGQERATFVLPDLPALAADILGTGTTKTANGPQDQVDSWKRHLLDLSNFNRLLNFKDTKKTVQLVCHSLAELEDRLADGVEFELHPIADAALPGEKGRNPVGLVALKAKNASPTLLASDFNRKRLRLKVSEDECGKRLLGIFREARTALQDSGANLLFLAIGFLHWRKADESDTVQRAPLIMIPLELKRKNGAEPFTMCMADDEPRINTTLLEMLRHEHGIAVQGVEPLPEDDHGIDIPKILTAFRVAVKDKAKWHIEEEGAIGLFSFTKFLMWRDLDEHPDLLEQQPLVANLIHRSRRDEHDGDFPDAENLDASFEPRDTFCPLSADSSQLAAVHAAAAGRSFILNGPPGTGKSQTIANMIAHCLAIGKTVLFVAEKAAALDVVRQRLNKIGLDRFCLELHSRKAQKSAVMAQLQTAWRAAGHAMPKNWLASADNLADVRRRLNRHCHALHKERPLGNSLFWGVSKNIGYQVFLASEKPLRLKWRPAEIARMDAIAYRRLCECVKELQRAAVRIGWPSAHPWRDVRCMMWKPMLTQYELTELLQAALAVHPDYSRATEAGRTLLPVMLNAGYEELQPILDKLCSLLRATPEVTPGFVLGEECTDVDMLLDEVALAVQDNMQLEKEIFERYHPTFLELNLIDLAQDFSALGDMGWFKRYLSIGKIRKAIAPTRLLKRSKLTEQQIHDDIVYGLNCLKKRAWIAEETPKLQALLGEKNNAATLDQVRVQSIKGWISEYRDTMQKLSALAGDDAEKLRLHLAKLAGNKRDAIAEAAKIEAGLAAWRHAGEKWLSVKRDLTSYLELNSEWFDILERQPDDALGKQLTVWCDNLEYLEGWCLWLQERNHALEAGLEDLVVRFEEGKIGAEQLFTLFDASFCHSWMMGTIGADESLASYSISKLQADLIHFKGLDAEYEKLSRETVCARLSERAAKVKASGDTRQTSILGNQLALKRGTMPIRRLLEETGDVIRIMMPCFLMSPISVAQYLGMRIKPFDVVIFDEASQIPAWDAVGIMARGKQVIIAGDPMQLPPTNFFQRQANSDDDAEDIPYQDLESVLDDCLSRNLKEVYLKWHYRSRNENLIAFSNHHYYRNQLLTFPSADRSPGVSLRHVNGVYDKAKSRTNPIEARAVADEVIRRLSDPALREQSIGVVTFNKAQQDLIEDLLDDARREHRSLDKKFDSDQPDYVLIKNLENVQGDERDVMLLSVCFGPDAAGKIGFNFGPLNRSGGERRLNVAITRAKYETVVFSSILPEQIDLTRTTATGAKHLRNYLDYALRGPVALASICESNSTDEFDSPFEQEVAEALRRAGYEVVTQVGCSGYRIDLGVVNPDNPGHFLLGVECDGANYHSAKTARDRDRLRELVLEGLGWRLHRVWSTDWFMNRRSALDKIMKVLQSALEKWRVEQSLKAVRQPTAKTTDGTEPPVAEVLAATDALGDESLDNNPAPERFDTDNGDVSGHLFGEEDNFENTNERITEFITTQDDAEEGLRSPQDTEDASKHIEEYIPLHFSGVVNKPRAFFNNASDLEIKSLLRRVIEQERPVALDIAALRVAKYWGHNALTDEIRNRIDVVMRGMRLPQKRHAGKVFLWGDTQLMDSYRGFRKNGRESTAKRNADDIAPEEYANAMEWVLQNSGPMSKDTAADKMFEILGIGVANGLGRRLAYVGCEQLINQRRAILTDDGVLKPCIHV